MFSSVKDENVVNPPQKPTTRNMRHSGETSPLRSKIPKRIPIRRHPVILTMKVPKGNADKKACCTYLLTRNLETLPRKPPAPTNMIHLNISKRTINIRIYQVDK